MTSNVSYCFHHKFKFYKKAPSSVVARSNSSFTLTTFLFLYFFCSKKFRNNFRKSFAPNQQYMVQQSYLLFRGK